jgi:hypothetical protein
VPLLDALYAFYQEHARCGVLDSAIEGDRRLDDVQRVRRGDQQVRGR